MGRALFILFATFRGLEQRKKSVQKKKNYSPENETRVLGRCLFLPYLI